ncbi:uncharacterized protein LOC102921407 isoform X2 [Peromyscus maniculatus bairdii]|uniref:uncharacterized protein LOC102921407 isoform X2 n=1 Tax=Peromyscus maniculatus bairdii TaxID=230844 RepID=UPI003FCF2EFD
MACKKYYFEHDIYGVGFYEEEVTSELQQRRATAANASHSEEVAGILEELGHLNAVIDHNYNREEKNSTRGKSRQPVQGRQEPVFRKPTRCCGKPYKFTPEQLLELDRVFEETQYPDELKRKELAELIDVEECTVKDCFPTRKINHHKISGNQACRCTSWYPDHLFLKILEQK